MKIVVFSDNKNIVNFFSKLKKDKKALIEYYNDKEFNQEIKKIKTASALFIDISKLTEQNLNKNLNLLSKNQSVRYIIIDPKNKIKDIASEFFRGCSDYIDKNLFALGLSEKRLSSALKFKPFEIVTEKVSKDSTTGPGIKKSNSNKFIFDKNKLSGNNWEGVKNNSEYIFSFMYIEIDDYDNIKDKLGIAEYKNFIETFQVYLNSILSTRNGKIWMWMEHGGLILFPFDGKNTFAIESALELYLESKILCINSYTMPISYKIALHIGNTIYKTRGKTGTIVSDTVNSIFHIGQKKAEVSSLYITGEYKNIIPESLNDFFIPEGIFEEREIFRFKKLLP